MDASQWQRAKEIFDHALQLDPEDRPTYLHAACGGNDGLLKEVDELLKAHADAGSFLGDRWLAPIVCPTAELILQPGDLVSGRFRIVKAVGKGGMGRVYEARDSTLGVRVALKTLRPEIATNPEVLLRFRSEVRIAHRITHPNVCRTFHLDHETRQVGTDATQTVDLTFITMEFLDGETLQQRLQRKGRLTLDESLSIASQMASGIEAAHRIGVIHRDIKPGNVMICRNRTHDSEQERVVITDFGLAKASTNESGEDATSLSTPGMAMGTLAYMAPEQLQGTNVTARADIYAFGLVLFEMIVGLKVFPDSDTPAAALARMAISPPSPREKNSLISKDWEDAITGCLQVEPHARFQRASDVIATISGKRIAIDRERRRLSVSNVRRYRSWSRLKPWPLFFLTTVCLVVSIFLWGSRFYQLSGSSEVAPGALVYLAPIANQTGVKAFDGLTELLRAGLDQSVQVNLLDTTRVEGTLQKMTRPADTPITADLAREIALRNNASRVILPSLVQSGGKYTLHVAIQQPDSNGPFRARAHWDKDFSWMESSPGTEYVSPEMIVALRNASDWARMEVGESQKDILTLNTSPEDVTTNRWDALSAFTEAERLDRSHKKWEAVLSLQTAVRLDPRFALAYARLGDIEFSINRDDDGVAAYRHALEASTERPLSRKELDRVQGMYATDTFDYTTAIQAFRDYVVFYPHDYIGWAYPTAALRALNLDEQAVANLRKAVILEPDNSFPVLALGDELIATKHIDEIPHWVNELHARGFDAAASQLEIKRRFLVFDFEGAYAELDKLIDSNDLSRRLRGLRTRIRIAAELGNMRRAMQAADDAIAESRAQGEFATEALSLEDRGALECQQGKYTACLDDINKAISLNNGRSVLLSAENILGPTLQVAPTSERPVLRLRIHALEQTIARLDFGFVTRVMRTRAHAESLLADRDFSGAITEMRKVASLDAPSGSREYLGRALMAAARTKPSGPAANTLLTAAKEAYGATALRREATWTDIWSFPPGFLAEELNKYLHLSAEVGDGTDAAVPALDFYTHLRPDSPEASQAFRLTVFRAA